MTRQEKTTERTDERAPRKRGPKPGTEAAKRGGDAVKKKYGVEFYRKIGKEGGTAMRRFGPDFFAEIGRKGGKTTSARLGPKHYQRIGKIGGTNKGKRYGGSREEEGAS